MKKKNYNQPGDERRIELARMLRDRQTINYEESIEIRAKNLGG